MNKIKIGSILIFRNYKYKVIAQTNFTKDWVVECIESVTSFFEGKVNVLSELGINWEKEETIDNSEIVVEYSIPRLYASARKNTENWGGSAEIWKTLQECINQVKDWIKNGDTDWFIVNEDTNIVYVSDKIHSEFAVNRAIRKYGKTQYTIIVGFPQIING